RMREKRISPDRIRLAARAFIAQGRQELLELVRAAVHIADDVERTVLVRAIVPERHALHRDGIDLLGALEDVYVPKAFLVESPDRPAQISRLRADDVRAEVPVGARPVSLVAQPLRHVE